MFSLCNTLLNTEKYLCFTVRSGVPASACPAQTAGTAPSPPWTHPSSSGKVR